MSKFLFDTFHSFGLALPTNSLPTLSLEDVPLYRYNFPAASEAKKGYRLRMFSTDTLKDKKILVTGGGSGLGFGIARGCAALGATVAICGRTEEKLLRAVQQITDAGGRAVCRVVDVRDYEAVGLMIDSLQKELGPLDSLVNNAAGNFYCTSEDLSPGGFKAVVDIVLHGTFNCTQHFGKHAIASGISGSILNIVTTYTETGSAFVLPSACAKAGVAALTTSLAFEWAEYNIRVNAIAPGPFPTPGAWKRLMPDKNLETEFEKLQPMKRFGNLEELVNLAVFLLSDMAPYINGEIVTIDGASRLRAGQFNFLSDFFPREKLREVFSAIRGSKD
ncbi:MAG: SDR family oxidoreductase [Bdellovibrionales bacterium]|nr:SDR family oxidoreductase [Bdellovibrionales bacterium]